jgi:hypothetical protein
MPFAVGIVLVRLLAFAGTKLKQMLDPLPETGAVIAGTRRDSICNTKEFFLSSETVWPGLGIIHASRRVTVSTTASVTWKGPFCTRICTPALRRPGASERFCADAKAMLFANTIERGNPKCNAHLGSSSPGIASYKASDALSEETERHR